MRAAVSPEGRKISEFKIVETPKSLRSGVLLLQKIARELGGGKRITAIVGGLAGSFDRAKNKIVGGGANIKGWVGQNIKKELERGFRAPVYLENDAALAGLAEAVKGAGRGKEIAVYYTVSTGFGGARIVRGQIDANARGFEPTYQVVDAPKLWRNYRRGRIGEYISGRDIETRWHKRPEDIVEWKKRDELAWWLAIAINNGILHWSPDIIVVGGSVMAIISLQRVRFYLKKIYKGYNILPPPVVKSKLGDVAGLHGALAYIKRNNIK